MTMGSLTTALTSLFLVCTPRWLCGAAPCDSSGFGGCEFNILGAAVGLGLGDKLPGYAPSGIEQFAYEKGGTTNLAYLCEDNTVAILYDCNARIPLYAATVMNAPMLNQPYKRQDRAFRASGDPKLLGDFQQKHADYEQSNKRHLCYEKTTTGDYFIEEKWFEAAEPGYNVPPNLPCCAPAVQTTPIHQGHLIAASYGRGIPQRQKATFTYTNVVPQFSVFNSGQWNLAERQVVEWGQENCANHNKNPTLNAHMYIVVGAIPSTYGKFVPRFFGQSGFSDDDVLSTRGDTYGPGSGGKEYRVNVPSYMWTAVCCTFQYLDATGVMQDEVKSTAFYRENEPSRKPINYNNIFQGVPTVEIFPNNKLCNL